MPVPSQGHYSFPVLTDFVCCKIVRSSVILLLPLSTIFDWFLELDSVVFMLFLLMLA
jgi:hypothetical protein